MDSNHDKQNQNLLCYRYTTGQWRRDRRTRRGGFDCSEGKNEGCSVSVKRLTIRLPFRLITEPLDERFVAEAERA